MPYIIRTKQNQLLILNHSAKNGLYSQILSSSGMSRPTIISRSTTSEYSATIDNQQNLHIILQPSKEQVIHLHYKDKSTSRNTILEDPKNIYNFSNLKIIYATGQIHLFYTANRPIGNSSELIHHILCEEDKIETCPILSFSADPLGFKYCIYKDTIFLLYGELSQHYLLKIMSYNNNEWGEPLTIAKSSFPIDDFQFCIDEKGRIHIIYVQEKYGRYNLIYKQYHNDDFSDENILFSTSSPLRPSIFTYHNGIWINFIDNKKLQMLLSMDNGVTFSKNVDCSLQTSDLKLCNFISAPDILPTTFNCNMIYISFSHTVRAGIISNIDMINFHPDIKSNTELELFIDGIFHSLPNKARNINNLEVSQTNIKDLQKENLELKQSQENMIKQYNDMTELTKRIQDEGKKWRDRALALSSELDEYKSKNS